MQGDEAETVIFSVAFSATKNGRFPLNFGPVTQQGGIRRLNVAVTRAQREMIVFSSFRPDDMGDLSNKAEGARMLQKFLQLAQKGAHSTGQLGVAVERSRHLADVAEAIRTRGFEVEVQLGFSQMRVDIAVRRPDADAWEVAILADGPTWAERGTAYQREVLPMRVLEGLGWQKVIRVWLPAWLEERDAILTEIENAFTERDNLNDVGDDSVDTSRTSATTPGSPTTTASMRDVLDEADQPTANGRGSAAASGTEENSSVGYLTEGHETTFDYPVFDEFPADLVGDRTTLDAAGSDRRVRQAVLAVIDSVTAHEGPVELDRLVKLTCRSFGLDRVRQSRRDEIVSIIPSGRIEPDPARSDRFVSSPEAKLSNYLGFRADHEAKRTQNQISTIEYVNAAVWILKQTGSLELEDMLRELGAVFGFDRVTELRREVLDSAIRYALIAGLIVEREDKRLCLP